MNLLLIDETQDYCQEIQQHLADMQITFTAQIALNAQQAHQMLEAHAFDLVLLSDQYSSDQCIALLESLVPVLQCQQTAILVLGGHDEGAHTLRCIEAGAHGLLLKSDLNARHFHHAVIQAQARSAMQSRLNLSYQKTLYIAEHDSLTDVGNRYLFDVHLQEAVQQCETERTCLGLVLLNIERFKMINDAYGHHAGDKTLCYLAESVSDLLKSNESIYRLGGDEFAILLRGLRYAHIDDIGQRILQKFSNPFYYDDHEIRINVNMGVAFYPQNADHADQLLRSADIAEYCARENGSNAICFVDEDILEQFQHRYFLEQSLRKGILGNELLLHYQPVVNAKTGQLESCEALVRWRHPEQGQIYPDRFIPVAEESGLIVDMGRWIIKEALRQLSQWRTSINENLMIALNISPQQLYDKHFMDFLDNICRQYAIPPHQVELEITETVLLKNTRTVLHNLNSLVANGYRIALDDFGTGYSSIQHLHEFPISTVKIDKSIMPNPHSSERSLSLLNGLVSMIKLMHLSIVAEGVETEEQVVLCRTLGIERLQGYHFSRPVSAEAFANHPLTSQIKSQAAPKIESQTESQVAAKRKQTQSSNKRASATNTSPTNANTGKTKSTTAKKSVSGRNRPRKDKKDQKGQKDQAAQTGATASIIHSQLPHTPTPYKSATKLAENVYPHASATPYQSQNPQ